MMTVAVTVVVLVGGLVDNRRLGGVELQPTVSKRRRRGCRYPPDMQKALFTLGLVLFLLGLLTGFVVPALKNPRMALSSHLEAVLNGMFLVVLGLLWPHIDLPHALGVIAIVLIVYAAYVNWLATLLAAAWGAGRKLAPIAAGDHGASAVKEGVVNFLLVSLGVSIVVGVAIVIAGL
jgi:hydroxylaminobenzene mutase